jgi:Aspartyl protease
MRALLFCLSLLAAGSAHAGCSVTPRASIPIQVLGNRIMLVPVTVNGIVGRFVLDTGAFHTMVSPAAVERFGLARDEWVGTTLLGVSGYGERTRNATPRSITLGGLPLQHRSLARDSSLVVATLPRLAPDTVVDGLLGRDFLSNFDLAIDVRARTVTLYDVSGCSGRFLPWTMPYTEVPVDLVMDHALVVPVQLDGVTLRALLDTGATGSLVAAPGMGRLGLTKDRLDGPKRQIGGVGPRPAEVQWYRFSSLRVGGVVQSNPLLQVASVRLVPIVDMILGNDWVAGRALWISYATARLFIADEVR